MLLFRLFALLFLCLPTFIFAQVGVGTLNPATSAQLEVNSTTKGFLPPRMTSSQRSAIGSPTAGLMVYQTDATAGLYYYNGSAWIYIINATTDVLSVANGGTGTTTLTANNLLVGNGTSAVSLIAPGNSGNVLVSNGTSWASQASLVPAGVISAFAGSSAPTGYLLCDGSAVSRSTYTNLFGVIGTTYGVGDGSTTFNLPDLRGRTIFGIDNMGGSIANRLTTTGGISANNSAGATGGSQTVTLATVNLPSHTHTFTGTAATTSSYLHNHTYEDAYYAENINGGTGGNARFGAGASSDYDNSFYWRSSSNGHSTSPQSINTSSDTHSHTVTATGTLSSTGSGTAFQNLPPLIVLNYLIKF